MLIVYYVSQSGSSSVVERLLAKEEVAGSSPVHRSYINRYKPLDFQGICVIIKDTFERRMKLNRLSFVFYGRWRGKVHN